MKKITFLFSALFFFVSCFSQDVFFTNTQQSLVYLNPSFSGSNGGLRNQLVYRNQWPNISGPTYVTYGNAFDAYIKSIKGGISGSIVTDDQGNGTFKSTTFNIAFAQYFSLFHDKLKVVPSIQATYLQEVLDKTKLNYGDMINARYNLIRDSPPFSFIVPAVSKKNVNFSSGVLFYYSKLIFGVSAFNINQPDIGMIGVFKLPVRTCLNISYNNSINPRAMINFSGVSNFQMGLSSFQLRATYIYNIVNCGMGYFYSEEKALYQRRYNNGFLINAGLHFERLNINYIYDAGIPKLSYNRAGSHEISISLNFRSKKDTIPKVGMEFW